MPLPTPHHLTHHHHLTTPPSPSSTFTLHPPHPTPSPPSTPPPPHPPPHPTHPSPTSLRVPASSGKLSRVSGLEPVRNSSCSSCDSKNRSGAVNPRCKKVVYVFSLYVYIYIYKYLEVVFFLQCWFFVSTDCGFNAGNPGMQECVVGVVFFFFGACACFHVRVLYYFVGVMRNTTEFQHKMVKVPIDPSAKNSSIAVGFNRTFVRG